MSPTGTNVLATTSSRGTYFGMIFFRFPLCLKIVSRGKPQQPDTESKKNNLAGYLTFPYSIENGFGFSYTLTAYGLSTQTYFGRAALLCEITYRYLISRIGAGARATGDPLRPISWPSGHLSSTLWRGRTAVCLCKQKQSAVL